MKCVAAIQIRFTFLSDQKLLDQSEPKDSAGFKNIVCIMIIVTSRKCLFSSGEWLIECTTTSHRTSSSQTLLNKHSLHQPISLYIVMCFSARVYLIWIGSWPWPGEQPHYMRRAAFRLIWTQDDCNLTFRCALWIAFLLTGIRHELGRGWSSALQHNIGRAARGPIGKESSFQEDSICQGFHRKYPSELHNCAAGSVET